MLRALTSGRSHRKPPRLSIPDKEMRGTLHGHPLRPCSQRPCAQRRGNIASHPLWKGPALVPGGSRQSPVNICCRDSIYDPRLRPLRVSYHAVGCLAIWNTGYLVQVDCDDSVVGAASTGTIRLR
ncbi:hypothetical protein MC885_005218 [Smutsia gigantea]|nr:hypothetical protein MC885_005218 [Smutsia gigantea]